LKTDITYYGDEQRERIIKGIKSLKLANFRYKSESSHQTGLIAQEVVSARLTELLTVHENKGLKKEGEYDLEDKNWGVDYSKIALLLIPCVQNLMRENETLRDMQDHHASLIMDLQEEIQNSFEGLRRNIKNTFNI
jgi:hypothetical protein